MPPTMRSVAINSYSEPAKFELVNLPVPSISSPTDVLIRVHAASINPGDLTLASGMTRLMFPVELPYKVGHDLSGTVVQAGAGVTEVVVGDDVYTNLPIAYAGSNLFLCLARSKSQEFIRLQSTFAKSFPGSASEYALTSSKNLTFKPISLSHVEAASLPCVAITTMQAFDSANSGGLSGKTIFVLAGLSGTGPIALRFAKTRLPRGKGNNHSGDLEIAKDTPITRRRHRGPDRRLHQGRRAKEGRERQRRLPL